MAITCESHRDCQARSQKWEDVLIEFPFDIKEERQKQRRNYAANGVDDDEVGVLCLEAIRQPNLVAEKVC